MAALGHHADIFVLFVLAKLAVDEPQQVPLRQVEFSLAIWLWSQSFTLRSPWLSLVRMLVRFPFAMKWNMVWCLLSDGSKPLETSAPLNLETRISAISSRFDRTHETAKPALKLDGVPA
jgi:hypothetical protein